MNDEACGNSGRDGAGDGRRRRRSRRAADEAAIAKIRTAYQTAAGTQDGAAIAKLYAPDGVEMPPNAPAAKGRAAIEAFHKAFGKQWMMHGMTITSDGRRRSWGDTAYDIGTYKQQTDVAERRRASSTTTASTSSC